MIYDKYFYKEEVGQTLEKATLEELESLNIVIDLMMFDIGEKTYSNIDRSIKFSVRMTQVKKPELEQLVTSDLEFNFNSKQAQSSHNDQSIISNRDPMYDSNFLRRKNLSSLKKKVNCSTALRLENSHIQIGNLTIDKPSDSDPILVNSSGYNPTYEKLFIKNVVEEVRETKQHCMETHTSMFTETD